MVSWEEGQGLVLRGSLTVMRRRCGSPGCHCANGELHETPVLVLQAGGQDQDAQPDRRRCRRGQRRPCPLPGGGGGASGAGGGRTGGPPGAPGGSTGQAGGTVSVWELILASASGCFTARSEEGR